MNTPAKDLFYHQIGRCIGCAQQQCPHPKLKKSNPMGSCDQWTDGNKDPIAYEVRITEKAYMVDPDAVQLNCTHGCKLGLPRKRDYPILFI